MTFPNTSITVGELVLAEVNSYIATNMTAGTAVTNTKLCKVKGEIFIFHFSLGIASARSDSHPQDSST